MALNGKELGVKSWMRRSSIGRGTVADMEYLIEKAEGISFWRSCRSAVL